MKKRSALIFGLLAAVLALSMAVTGCDNGSTGGGGGGSIVPAELIGKWEGSGGDSPPGPQYIEFTSDNKILTRMTEDGDVAATATVTSVSGNKVSIQATVNNVTREGSFKYTLNAAKTELTPSEQEGAGDFLVYAKYTKQTQGPGPGGET